MSDTTHNQIENNQEDHGSDKLVTIIVNGKEKKVKKQKISFEALVGLAYSGNPPSAQDYEFTVTYRRGPAPHDQGELDPGESVMVVENMIFNVTATKKS